MNDNTKGLLNEDSSIPERYAVSAGNILTSSVLSLVLGPMIVNMKAVCSSETPVTIQKSIALHPRRPLFSRCERRKTEYVTNSDT
jgi:hypothetical protein